MFLFVSEKNCPSCGARGKVWKKEPEVLICPQCNSYYNEFGIIVEARIEEVFE